MNSIIVVPTLVPIYSDKELLFKIIKDYALTTGVLRSAVRVPEYTGFHASKNRLVPSTTILLPQSTRNTVHSIGGSVVELVVAID